MHKGIRVFAAALLLVTLFASTAFAGPRDPQNVSLFARFLAWVTDGWWSSPPTGTPSPNGHWSPPGGSPQPNGHTSPPIGAPTPDPDPETQGHLSPPGGAPDALPPATTT